MPNPNASGDIYENSLPVKPVADLTDYIRILTGGRSYMSPVASFHQRQIQGLAYLATDPGTPDTFDTWLAIDLGVYVNFGGVTANPKDLLVWDGTQWVVVPGADAGFCTCVDIDPEHLPNPPSGTYYVGIWDDRPWFKNSTGNIREFLTKPWLDVNYIDLTIELSADSYTPYVGTQITVSVSIRNNGNLPDTGVYIGLPAPSGMVYVSDNGSGVFDPVTQRWTVGNFPAGQHRVLEIVYQINTSNLLEYTGHIQGDGIDSHPLNNTDSISILAKEAIDPAYYGKNVSGTPPTPAEIQAGTAVPSYPTSPNQFTFPPNIEGQFLWVAIPDASFPGDFNKWEDVQNTLNRGDIGTGLSGTGADFITRILGLTPVGGVDYVIYMSNYLSYFKNDLKLYKE